MKQRIIYKLMAGTLAALMLCSAVSCAKTPASSGTTPPTGSTGSTTETKYYNETGYPICDKPITVEVAHEAGKADYMKSKSWEIIKKELGIELKSKPIISESWNDQFTLMLSTDALPDLIKTPNGSLSLVDIEKYGKTQGFFADIKQYMDLMPNMKKLMDGDSSGAFERNITSSDSKIYGFATYRDSVLDTNVVRTWIDLDFLKNCGIDKIPTTVDEFYETLKAFKENDANGNGDKDDEIPLDFVTTWHGDYITRMLMGAFGITTSSPKISLMVQNGKVVLGQTTENYKEYLKFMHKLYAEGLMSEDAFSQTHEQHEANITAQRTGVFGADAFNLSNGQVKDNTHYGYIGGLASKYTNNKVYTTNSESTSTPVIFISSKSQYPEAICRLVDYYYDPKHGNEDFGGMVDGFNCEFKKYGSTDYEMLVKKPEWDGLTDDQEKAKLESLGYEAVGSNVFSVFPTSQFTSKGLVLSVDDKTLRSDDLVNTFGWSAVEEIWMRDVKPEEAYCYPTLAYTAEQATEISTIKADIKEYVNSQFAAFVIGKQDIDAEWDNYQSELKKAGLDRLLEVEQAAYDATMNKG